MARADIFKKIKDDVLLDNRIQVYRLHYTYLQTCLKHSDEFKVNRAVYSKWNLEKVKTWKFDYWWKNIDSELMGKRLTPPRIVKGNPKIKDDTVLIEVSKDNPTEYSITKIRQLLQSKSVKEKDQRNHHIKLSIYLDAWNLKRDENLSLKKIRLELIAKRAKLLKQRGSDRSAMDFTATENFLKYDPDKVKSQHGKKKWGSQGSSDEGLNQMRNLERQISRYKLNALKILKNVSRGEFPGKFSS